MEVEQTEYQKEYDKAAAELEAKANGEQKVEIPVKPEAVEPAKEPEKVEVDPLEEIKQRLEKAEKIAKDNQARATRAAQEAAELRREREQAKREANKPAILDANPELAQAIRYVSEEQANRVEPKAEFRSIVEKAHPGIFNDDIDPELQKTIMARLEVLDDVSRNDPLVFIREVTEGKLAHTEQLIGKRFAAESAKLSQKSAMSVPSANSSGVRTPPDTALEEVQRIQNMSDADFQKEVRRVKGY